MTTATPIRVKGQTTPASTDYKPLTWADLLADPTLQDLPYKVELENGKVVMSPAGNKHGMVQAAVYDELKTRADGLAWVEGSVLCGNGDVQVADVVWMSNARHAQHGAPDPMQVAPEICVEVQSPSNTNAEMQRKARRYLEAGALEVWIVKLDGTRQVLR